MPLLDNLRVLVDDLEKEDLCTDLQRFIISSRELQDDLDLLIDCSLSLESQVL